MTKDSFIQHMSVLKTLHEQYEVFFEKLHDLNIDIGNNEHFYKAFDEAIRIIAEEIGGNKSLQEETIFYYIYETDWGINGENCITITDDDGSEEDVSLTSFASLYDYLQYLNK